MISLTLLLMRHELSFGAPAGPVGSIRAGGTAGCGEVSVGLD
jgi:hypothetical protein